MEIRFKKVKFKGKFEYMFSPNGDYLIIDDEFVKGGITSNNSDKTTENEIFKLFKEYPKLKHRVKAISNIDKKLYYLKVWIITESNDLTKLKNNEKRGFKRYHLDHKFPIAEGFKQNISPEVIGDIRNLEFIPRRKNLKKSDNVTPISNRLVNSIIGSKECSKLENI